MTGAEWPFIRPWLTKNVIIFVRTSAMVLIYTSVDWEKDCFEGQIVKT